MPTEPTNSDLSPSTIPEVLSVTVSVRADPAFVKQAHDRAIARSMASARPAPQMDPEAFAKALEKALTNVLAPILSKLVPGSGPIQ